MAIEFKGLEGLFESLDKISNPLGAEQALKQACIAVETAAAMKAPKSLEQSITSKVEGLTGEVFTPVPWAPYVEYGTGIHATGPGGGRQDVPWVFVMGSPFNDSPSKKKYTLQSAKQTVAIMKSKGIDGATYTFGQEPQPFMRPALDENRELVLRIIKEGITKK